MVTRCLFMPFNTHQGYTIAGGHYALASSEKGRGMAIVIGFLGLNRGSYRFARRPWVGFHSTPDPTVLSVMEGH